MTEPTNTTPTFQERLAQTERTLYDTRSLVGMINAICAMHEEHEIGQGPSRDMWAGLRLVTDQIDKNLSRAINDTERIGMDIGKAGSI